MSCNSARILTLQEGCTDFLQPLGGNAAKALRMIAKPAVPMQVRQKAGG